MEDIYSLNHHHHNPSVNYSSASDVVSSMSSSSSSSSSASSSPLLQENMQQLVSSINYQSLLLSSSLAFQDHHHRVPIFGSDRFFSSSSSTNCNSVATAHEHHQTTTTNHIHPEEDDTMMMSMQKAKIAAHPRYPSLLQAYIESQKVGAPTEVANKLDDIRRYHQDNIHGYFCSKQQQHRNGLFSASRLGQDPELDNFMETYCDILRKYKMDLSRPFDEATSFLNKIELQLSHLSDSNSSKSNLPHPAPPSTISMNPTCLSSDHEAGGGGSEDEVSGGEIEIHQDHHHNNQIVHQTMNRVEDRDLKDKLLRKYSGYISSLKQEFWKKKKKGKLPKEARQALLNWWDIHNRWPYPTEGDKIALAEATNLDQKQINNWFINQRKRHWKPSENMQFSLMDNLSTPFCIQD